jgi:lauroyl/myristoyl acyltransferase
MKKILDISEKELLKLLRENAHRAWMRDLKKTYPQKTKEEIEQIIEAVEDAARNYFKRFL